MAIVMTLRSARAPVASLANVFAASTAALTPNPLKRRHASVAVPPCRRCQQRRFTAASPRLSADGHDDPRVKDVLGREILDDYARIREHYGSDELTSPQATPKYPIVLAHGLLGFSVLRAHSLLPPIHYWHGITTALHEFLGPNPGLDGNEPKTGPGSASPVKLITPAVPPSGTIEQRAEALAAAISAELSTSTSPSPSPSPSAPVITPPQPINIIAHSMGGLDARYLISRLPTPSFRVASLVTVATPHRGSPFADFMLERAGLESWYGLIGAAGLGTGAFRQLTTAYARDEFNPSVPDAEDTRYFSFGASLTTGDNGGDPAGGTGAATGSYAGPPPLSPFRLSWRAISDAEGPNDGLVSVASSRWGTYRGTLSGVNHLDLINWTNRAKWEVMRLWTGRSRSFNAVALYLDIADMLAREGF